MAAHTNDRKRIRGPLLVIVGLALIAITAVVLISLYSPLRRQAISDENASVEKAGGSGGSPGPAQPSAPSPTARPAQPVIASGSGGGPVARPAPAPSSIRAEAPAAIPSEIQSETDPVKRAELMKMHKLTTARVRLSMLRRRRQLLHKSLDEARRQKTWSTEKVQSAERQLEEIGTAVTKAEEHLDQVREEVGGDIDKGAR